MEELLKEEQVSKLCNFSRGHLKKQRKEGKGPRYIRLNGRSIRYRMSDLEEYINSFVVGTKESE